MKLIILSVLLLMFATNAFSQKETLKAADTELENYEVLRLNKTTTAAADQSLINARSLIDSYSFKQGSATAAYAAALKAAIYSSFIVNDKVTNREELFNTARLANEKAVSLDIKGKYKRLIGHANLNISFFDFNKGQAEFKNQNFKAAYYDFDAARQLLPTDTTFVKYTAMAAANEGVKNQEFYHYAVENYSMLLLLNEAQKPTVYQDLSTLYLVTKDTSCALSTINKGLLRYQDDRQLLMLQVGILLKKGQYDALVPIIKNGIFSNPKDKTIYYYGGIVFTKEFDQDEKKMHDAKSKALKNSLLQSKTDNYKQAVDLYKTALELDPNYFEANLNIGVLLLKPAMEIYADAYKIPSNQTKEFDMMISKSNMQFDLARPYLQRAINLNPRSKDALIGLRSYYLGKTDKVHAKENMERAAVLKKQIEAL